MGVLVGGVAALIGTTQFYQLSAAFLLLLVVAFVLGIAGSRGIGFSRLLPPDGRFTAGEPARLDLEVSGRTRGFPGGSVLEVVDRLPEPRSFEARLSWKGEAAVAVPVTFPRRGVYTLGPAEVRAMDPFGLWSFARRFEERREIVVYPEIYPLPGFPLWGGSVEAGYRGAHGRREEEFTGLREYRRGDERRHIHWKSVARTGELFVKEFAVEAPRRYTVALDMTRHEPRVPEREVEDAVSAAASVLSLLREDRLPARLLCSDREGRSSRFGEDEASHWERMRLLATVRADGERGIREVIREEGRELGEVVVMVLRARGNHVEGISESVRRMREMGLSVVVVALAAHTYREHPFPGEREAEFDALVGRLEALGATARTVRYPEGVAGLADLDAMHGVGR